MKTLHTLLILIFCILSNNIQAGNILSNNQTCNNNNIELKAAPFNEPPGKPVLLTPANGATIRAPFIVDWECSDPDGDILTYNVDIWVKLYGMVVYEDLVSTDTSSYFDSRDYDLPSQAYGLTIEWQVTASDGVLETSGDIWSMIVSGTNNTPEFTNSPTPADQSSVASLDVDCIWECTDSDDDPLTYTFCYRESGTAAWICFQSLANNQYSLNFNESDRGKTYEWYVTADDGYETTESPTWSFSICYDITTTEYITICDSENYFGHTESGTYHRTYTAANGCDSVITTFLTVNPHPEKTEDIVICEGDSYRSWTEAGLYQWRKPATIGCDTSITTNLIVLPAYNITENIAICEGETYKGRSETGIYTDSLLSVNGCDSVILINLTVIEPYQITENITICQGASYKGHNTAGTYVETLSSVNGCDSTVTTVLTIADALEYTEHISICEGESYKGRTTTSVFEETLTSINGCDSTVTTHLTVNPVKTGAEDISICEGESYKGWDTSGTYYETLTSAKGCDSIVTITLTVHSNNLQNENISICEGETYKKWDTTGTYRDTLSNINGCDSIIITQLTVNPVYDIKEDVTIYNGETYKTWSATGVYKETLVSVNGCDSIITTNLTVLNNPPAKPTLISPENEAYVFQPFTLSWECSDPDNDQLTYSVRIRAKGVEIWLGSEDAGTETSFIISGLIVQGVGVPIEWQVIASDGQDESYSDIWSVTICDEITSTEYISICEGETYKTWDTEGVYKDTLKAVSGCDSIATTYLTVLETFETTKDVTICEGESYNGLSTPGEYAETYKSVNGCDSIINIILHVNPTYEVTETISICQGESYNNWTISGTYQRILSSVTGCDSTVLTKLTVHPKVQTDENITICEGESYEGWTKSGIYKRTLVSSHNCDSVVATILTVIAKKETTENVTICKGESYNGWDKEGTYTETFASSLGCDSVVITNLSFYPSVKPEIIVTVDTLKSSTTYFSYQWNDESGEIPGATNRKYVISKSGKYYLTTTDNNGCENISETVEVIYSSVNSIAQPFKYSIIPNPNKGEFKFRADSNLSGDLQLTLISPTGQIIEKRLVTPIINHAEHFNLSGLSKGIYYLIITSDNFQKSEKIIVQ